MFDGFGVGLGGLVSGFDKTYPTSPGLAGLPDVQQLPAQPVATAAAAPASSGTPPAQASTGANFGSYLQDLSKKYNLPTDYLAATAKIESSFNPNAVSSTGATGVFQFTKGTAKRMGLNNRFDPYQSADAAARLAADNRASLTKAIGRDPTAGELYLAHQQGASGAANLLANPDMKAVDALASAYGGNRSAAQRAITVNGGNANMTAGQFAARWTGKFDGSSTAVASVPNVSGGKSETSARPTMVASGNDTQSPGLGLAGKKQISFSAPGIVKQPSIPALQQTPVQAPNFVPNSGVIAETNPLPMNWQA